MKSKTQTRERKCTDIYTLFHLNRKDKDFNKEKLKLIFIKKYLSQKYSVDALCKAYQFLVDDKIRKMYNIWGESLLGNTDPKTNKKYIKMEPNQIIIDKIMPKYPYFLLMNQYGVGESHNRYIKNFVSMVELKSLFYGDSSLKITFDRIKRADTSYSYKQKEEEFVHLEPRTRQGKMIKMESLNPIDEDVYIELKAKKHEFLELWGDDLFYIVNIKYHEILLEPIITYKYIDDKLYKYDEVKGPLIENTTIRIMDKCGLGKDGKFYLKIKYLYPSTSLNEINKKELQAVFNNILY